MVFCFPSLQTKTKQIAVLQNAFSKLLNRKNQPLPSLLLLLLLPLLTLIYFLFLFSDNRNKTIKLKIMESMDASTTSAAGESSTARIVVRSSMIESIRACGLSGLSGVRIDKEELRRRLLIPQYIRLAMLDSIRKKDVDGGDLHFRLRGSDDIPCPESPLVVFINPRSGGRYGPVLKERLQQLISEEQVNTFNFLISKQFYIYFLKIFFFWKCRYSTSKM